MMNSLSAREVFRLINPQRPQLGPWLIFLVIADVICWMLWLLNQDNSGWLLPVAVLLTLFPFAVYLFQWARAQHHQTRYIQWLNDTGFPVLGWERLGREVRLPEPYYWVGLNITVLLKPGTTPENIRFVEEALVQFTISAARAFYRADHVQPGSSKDLRSNWAADALTAGGSANREVMGYLYYFLRGSLREFHNETNAVEAVRLDFGKTIFQVRPVQIRGAGNT